MRPKRSFVRLVTVLTLVALVAGCIPAPLATAEPATATTAPTRAPALPSPTTSATETELPEATLALPTVAFTPTPPGPLPSGLIHVFPGPEVYAGDLLSLEIPLVKNQQDPGNLPVTLSVDGQARTLTARLTYSLVYRIHNLLILNAWDTTGQTGRHTLRVQAEVDGQPLDVSREVEVLPAELRPDQEINADWVITETDCCRLFTVENTAASRDVNYLARLVDQSMAEVADQFDLDPEEFDETFFLIDRVWGNGGYASDEGIVIYWVDRDYGPGLDDEIITTFRHEATHQAQWLIDVTPAARTLDEGLAVYVGGGHYYHQPIPQRAAALYRLGYGIPITDMDRSSAFQVHEVRYLQAAGLIAYVVERYGWDKFMQLYTTRLPGLDANQDWAQWLDGALRQTLDLDLERFSQDFTAWLESIDPGTQIDDLRLTVRLQQARRTYQYVYAPFPELYSFEGDFTQLQPLALLTREADEPLNQAVESLIHNAQQAIQSADFAEAERLIGSLEEFIRTGRTDRAPLDQYRSVAEAVTTAGYETVSIWFEGDLAKVEAYSVAPEIRRLTLDLAGDYWQIVIE